MRKTTDEERKTGKKRNCPAWTEPNDHTFSGEEGTSRASLKRSVVERDTKKGRKKTRNDRGNRFASCRTKKTRGEREIEGGHKGLGNRITGSWQ